MASPGGTREMKTDRPSEADEAQAYLSRLLTKSAPTCEPLPDLLGVCSQIDNLLQGCIWPGTGVKAEDDQLLADHSEALKFVREMSIQPCPHWCADDCLACRANAWLHAKEKRQ